MLFTLFLSVYVLLQSQAQCNATIGYEYSSSMFADPLWVDNFIGDTSNTTFTWVFCYGDTTSGMQTLYIYPSGQPSAPCEVCLTVEDSVSGCVYIVCDTVGVPSASTSCSAYANFVTQDSLYGFFASSIAGNAVSYQWTVNGVLVSTDSIFGHVITSAIYPNGVNVCVSITQANGCVSTDCIAISGSNSPIGGGNLPCQAYFAIYPDTGANSSGIPGNYYGYNL